MFTVKDIDLENELKTKIEVIREFNKCTVPYFHNVINIELEVYIKKAPEEYVQESGHSIYTEEFIVVQYVGGAYSVDPANGNSNYANLCIAVKRLNSGNYNHEYYEKIKSDSTWQKL